MLNVFGWELKEEYIWVVGINFPVINVSGYEKYNQMRQDQKLCFLGRCGPPDGKALLAEQNDDDDLK